VPPVSRQQPTKMAFYPGLKFMVIVDPDAAKYDPLPRTPSLYDWGLEVEPVRDEVYMIGPDRTVQSFDNPSKRIGWTIFEKDGGFYYCVTQVNFEPVAVMVSFVSTPCYSREADIYHSENDGEPEVTSTPVCPGAPLKRRLF